MASIEQRGQSLLSFALQLQVRDVRHVGGWILFPAHTMLS
jgi:hypothetical protein